jgi:hypothetical protein
MIELKIESEEILPAPPGITNRTKFPQHQAPCSPSPV